MKYVLECQWNTGHLIKMYQLSLGVLGRCTIKGMLQ
jgi:hypothetical protein